MRFIKASIVSFFLILSCVKGIVRVEIPSLSAPKVNLEKGSIYALLPFEGDTEIPYILFEKFKSLEKYGRIKGKCILFRNEVGVKELKREDVRYLIYGRLLYLKQRVKDTSGVKFGRGEGLYLKGRCEIEFFVKDILRDTLLLHEFIKVEDKVIIPRNSHLKDIFLENLKKRAVEKFLTYFLPEPTTLPVYLIESDENLSEGTDELRNGVRLALLGAWEMARYRWQKLDERSYAALYNMGISYEREGRMKDALTYYKKALSLCENCTHVRLIKDAIRRVSKWVQ